MIPRTDEADIVTGPAAGAGGGRRRRPSDPTMFFGLAYGFSWAWLAPLVVTGAVVTAGTGRPTQFPALLGPLAAAVVLTAIGAGRPGLTDMGARMIRGSVPLRW